MKMTDKIRRLLTKGKTAKEIATQLKIEPNRVYTVKWLDAKKVTPEQSSDPAVREVERQYIKKSNAVYKAKKTSKIIEAVQEMKSTLDALDKIKDKPKKSKAIQEGNDLANKIFQETYDKYHPDLVNHPPHYKSGGIETIDFIEAKDLNYRLGNVVKYVSRAGRKNSDPVQDLEKAAWYLQREIAARKNA
jgi:hypothetical protein